MSKKFDDMSIHFDTVYTGIGPTDRQTDRQTDRIDKTNRVLHALHADL